jgi:SNF family Na+-dependent transporter
LYGVVVFSGIGYLSKKLNANITDFVEDGFGLVFVIYPEIIATFNGASIFAIIFFLMLISLGIDSAFGGMEGLYTAITDEYPYLKRHKFIFRAIISGVPFLTSLATVTYGGSFVVQWLDTFSVNPSVLVIVLIEIIVIAWIFGINRFSENVEEMNSKKPFLFFIISLKIVTPVCLILIVLFSMIQFRTLQVGAYTYPLWSSVLGWGINAISLLPIPIYIFYFFVLKRV